MINSYLLHNDRAFVLKDARMDGGTLLVPVFDDTSTLSSVLVSSIWFDEELLLMLDETVFKAKVHRIDISGPLFRDFLHEMRKTDPCCDFASLAVIGLLKEEKPESGLSSFEIIGPSEKAELHLDNMGLRCWDGFSDK